MQIDGKSLKQLEKIAALRVSDEDLTLNYLNQSLDFLAPLKDSDLSFYACYDAARTSTSPLRKDEAVEQNVVKSFLAQAPAHGNEYFLVPKILD